MFNRYVAAAIAAASIHLPLPAFAQTNAPQAQGVPSTPERTTATFGDWILRCEAAPSEKRVCEVAHIIMAQGQNGAAAQVAIGKLPTGETRQITVLLPANVSLLAKPQIVAQKAGVPAIDLAWQRCVSGACLATAPLADQPLAAFSAQTDPARIVFKDPADRDVILPLSLRGLQSALAALAKEK